MPAARLERERAQRITRPFPGGESYLQVVDRVASLLEELVRDWDQARVVVVGHSATRWALDCLLTGAALHDLVAAPFAWQGAGRMPCLQVGGDLTWWPAWVIGGAEGGRH
jgi:broad specificity phosphatase PhoE